MLIFQSLRPLFNFSTVENEIIDKKMKKCKCFCEKNVKKLIFLRILEEFVDKFLETHGKNKV